jgi:hypothetical protein
VKIYSIGVPGAMLLQKIFYYIVESEILKNTDSEIFSISSLVKISIT